MRAFLYFYSVYWRRYGKITRSLWACVTYRYKE